MTRELLGFRMQNVQDIAFIRTQTYRGIFKQFNLLDSFIKM